MATVTKGRTFVSGETVTPAKLNDLVDSATVTSIVDADVSASAAIALSKLATGALPTAITVASANIVDGTIVAADIASGAVTAAKLDGAQTGSAPIYGCRAWVNFNGTRNATDTGASTNGANVLIRASGNVSSVLKNGTGDYTITFTTAMPDANYAVFGSVVGSTTANGRSFITGGSPSALTTSSVRVLCVDVNNTINDCDIQQVAVLR